MGLTYWHEWLGIRGEGIKVGRIKEAKKGAGCGESGIKGLDDECAAFGAPNSERLPESAKVEGARGPRWDLIGEAEGVPCVGNAWANGARDSSYGADSPLDKV